MGMNIDDAQLLSYLLDFVTGMPIQCDEIRVVDLYGDKKPSQLFDTTTTTTYHYVITQLKKRKTGKCKNFNRGIVGGGGTWKTTSISRPVYDKRRSEVGFKKSFRFDEKNQSWYMKAYRLSDEILEVLRRRGQIRYEEEFVVCRIRRNVNADHIRESFLASSSSQCQETVKSFAQENQELGQSSAAAVIPSVTAVHQETPSVSFVAKESNVPAAKEEECSVPVVHQETHPEYDIATYHKKLDAYAASVLETMVPHIPEQKNDEDEIPLFGEDFYIGHTNLWS